MFYFLKILFVFNGGGWQWLVVGYGFLFFVFFLTNGDDWWQWVWMAEKRKRWKRR